MMFQTVLPPSSPSLQQVRPISRLRIGALAGLALMLCAMNATVAAQNRRARRGATQQAPPVAEPAQAVARQATPVAEPVVAIDEANDRVLFSFDSDLGMPLIDFVKWTQELTGKRFTYNAMELGAGTPSGGRIHFIGELSIARDRFRQDFFSFFQTMLYIKGFAIVPRGEGHLELLEIVMMTGTRGREISNSARYVAPDELTAYRFQSGVPILTTVPLKHIDAQRANNALRPFFASTGGSNAGGSVQIGNVGNKSALLLQGFGPQVYAAAQLLKLVDVPAATADQPATAPERAAGFGAQRLKNQSQSENQSPKAEQLLKLLKNHRVATAAQPSATRKQEHDGGDDVVAVSMTKRDGMQLTEFVKWTQEMTGKRFTYSPQELASGGSYGSKVNFLGTFQFPRKSFKQDFYAFFQTMLYIKGFAIIPRGEGDLEVLEIVMMQGTRGRAVANGARYVAPDEIEQYRNQTGVPILTTVKLRHINAQLATNALRPFFASTGGSNAGGSVQIGNVGNKSSLLLQGFGPQVYAAVLLLRLVDTPAEDLQLVMQVIQLKHKTSKEVQPLLTEVLERRRQIREQVQLDNGTQVRAGSSRPQLKIVAHGAQNALVVSGTQEQLGEAAKLIARLDVPDIPIEGTASVVHLKHTLAEDIANTLKKLMVEDNLAKTSAATGDASGAPTKRKRKTVINAHKSSNSLLISAPLPKWKQLKILIEKLDKPTGNSGKDERSKDCVESN